MKHLLKMLDLTSEEITEILNLADQLKYVKVSTSLQFGLGCESFNKVEVKAGYRFGIGETLRTRLLDQNTAKNRTFFIQATYYIK